MLEGEGGVPAAPRPGGSPSVEKLCVGWLWEPHRWKYLGWKEMLQCFESGPPSTLLCNLTHAAFPGQQRRYKEGGGERRKPFELTLPGKTSSHPE